MLDIYIDADGCPVKQEVYRVARRYGLKVILVANSWMRVPFDDNINLVVVDEKLDSADDWIAGRVAEKDIVITGDIPLASRCLEKGARVIGSKGRIFTEDSIGEAMATRDLMSRLREMGTVTGGPSPMGKRDRSRFLQRLDEVIQSVRRSR